MEMQTEDIGTAENYRPQEPEQKPQEQGQQEPNQQQQDDENFQLLVDDLFDSYNPGSPLEDAAIIRMARALWEGRDHDKSTSDKGRFDQEIDVSLAQLSKSQAIRRAGELPRQAAGSLSSIRHKNPHWGLVRRSVGLQMRAHPRCSRKALQLWAPNGLGNGSSSAETKDRARALELDRKKTSEGVTLDEEIERAAIEDRMFERSPLAAPMRAWERASRGETS